MDKRVFIITFIVTLLLIPVISSALPQFMIEQSELINKILLGIIIFGLAYAGLDFFLPNKGIVAVIALAFSFLAVVYLAPEEILLVLSSYNVTGMALAAFLPFVVLVFFDMRLLTEKLDVGRIFLHYLLWLLFILFLIYRIVLLNSEGLANPTPFYVAFAIVLGLSAIMMAFGQRLILWLYVKTGVENINIAGEKLAALYKAQKKMAEALEK